MESRPKEVKAVARRESVEEKEVARRGYGEVGAEVAKRAEGGAPVVGDGERRGARLKIPKWSTPLGSSGNERAERAGAGMPGKHASLRAESFFVPVEWP